MGCNDHVDRNFHTTFSELVANGSLVEGTVTHEICEQIARNGYSSLSELQSYVFQKEVEPILKKTTQAIEAQRAIDSTPVSTAPLTPR